MRRATVTSLLCLAIALMATARGDDLDTVSGRITSDLTSAALSATAVNGYLTTLGTNGRWSDVDYADTSQTGWSQQAHLTRLLHMSRAYANPTHSLYGSAALLAGIVKAYDSFVSLDPRSTNWWYNEINTPQLLGGTILLVQSQLSAAQITSGTAIVGRSYIPRSTNGGTNTGTNRMDRAYATILRGVIARDSPLTAEAFAAIGDTLVTTTGEGIQPDYSFHQHGPQLNNGSYGLTFGSLSLEITSYAAGTGYALADAEAHVIVDYLLDGQQWMLRGTTFDHTAQGRGVTRTSSRNLGSGIIGVIDQAKSMTTYRAAELTAMRDRLNAAKTSGTAATSLALTGHRHFWRSDFSSHQRPGFSATVKVSSTRTLEPETGNGEGLQNLHLADGVNLIQRRGTEYTDIQPIWDWRRLPGTTTEQATYSLTPGSTWGVAGSTGFAGGVSDGRNGATVLDYSQRNVKARKAWFFFDDIEVALGSGIDAPAATGEVITTLNQTFQSGAASWSATSGSSGSLTTGTVSRSDVAWVLHDGVGYVFPSSQNVTLRAALQSGSWSGLNNVQSSALVTGSVFSLQVGHGTAPSGGGYSYVVLPGVSGSAVSAYAANPAVRILSNTRNLQAVRHDAMRLTQAAFYASGTLATGSGATLTIREPALVMFDESAAARLSVSNPYGLATTIHADVVRTRDEGPADLTRITMRLPGGADGGTTVSRVLETPAARTYTSQLRDVARSDPALLYQWSFEGTTAADQLRNSGTGVGGGLQALAYGTAGSTAAIGYGMGLDESTTAMSPQRLGRLSSTAGGAALATTGSVTLPSAYTVEALVRPELLETGGSIGYAVNAGGQATNNRSYFVVQQEGSAGDSLSTIIGDSISQADNKATFAATFETGRWYYVASTYAVSGSQTTINTYVADLTAGQQQVTRAISSQVASGVPLTTARMALGGFLSGTAMQEAWAGSLDEVSVFGRTLSLADVQSRVDALYRAPTQVAWSGATTGTAIGGSGTWSDVGMRWVHGSGRLSPVAASRAVFSGSAGTVAVAGRVGSAGLSFQSTGYVLRGGTVALVSGTARPTIDVGSGLTATLAATVTSTSGIAKTGGGTLALTAPLLASGTIDVTAGRLSVSGSAAAAQSRLTVTGGTVSLPDDPAFEFRVAGLSVGSDGLVDVGRARLNVAAGGLTRQSLLAELTAGRGDGSWNGGRGIASASVAASAATGQTRSLGWMQEADGSFTIAFTAAGDGNLDGLVDILDAADLLAAGRYDRGVQAGWAEGDYNYDGIVDLLDVADTLGTGLFDAGFATNAGSGTLSATVISVPEPSGAAVATIGAVAAAWARCRRRRE
jgi:chondroitin AC lyase